jgi:hypothetical protein
VPPATDSVPFGAIPAEATPPEAAEIDADAVVEAALSCPLVAGMADAVLPAVATYLPGRRVHGVRVDGDAVEVHVVARWEAPMPVLADQVRRAVAVVTGRSVSVFIDDIELPGRDRS